MARVFTITPGLENMGGLKTGGQGSIYKGRRIGEIITAVKILPTPIYSESSEDSNYTAFQNEVEKLKKVNEIPNPNVVKILSSGISEQGNFPFIEMEYIEGPDLEEILQSPDHSVFTINETLKVAEQLSNAIAHCHRMGVRHGDIKSNNIKFNSDSGNYILLDFGLAIMSDEQRRSNLSHVGAIEFMAPEQNTGQMLFETDVYSFGNVLFELLAGTVPFPLKGNGESARNEVRLAHMVSPVPNLLELRRAALPDQWDDQRKKREMQVPQWLLDMINKCLEKKPERRFANGIEVHNYIVQQFISKRDNAAVSVNKLSVSPLAGQDFVVNHEQLKKQLSQYRQELIKKESELKTLKELLNTKEAGLRAIKYPEERVQQISKNNRVSKTSFAALLFLTVALGTFAMYPVIKKTFFANSQITDNSHKRGSSNSNRPFNNRSTSNPDFDEDNKEAEQPAQIAHEADSAINTPAINQQSNKQDETVKEAQKTIATPVEEKPVDSPVQSGAEAEKPANQADEDINAPKKPANRAEESNDNSNQEKNAVSKKYLVVSKAYFYNAPNEDSRRNEFISPLEKAVVQSLHERYGFIYVVITNPQGQVFKGWLRKKELKLYSIE